MLEQALRLGDEGDWDGMAILLRESLDDDPANPYLLCWLGVAERELGLEGIAYEHFKQALASEPDDPNLLATAGNALAAFDDPAAEPALRAAALTAPDLPVARWMYGAYLAREGMTKDALRELTAARELDPDDATIALELGVARALSGDLEGAMMEFESSVDLDPGDGWAQVLLGLTMIDTGDLERGAGMLEWAAQRCPEDVEAQLLTALAMAASGDADRALTLIEGARFRAGSTDLQLLVTVQEHVDEGPDAARDLLQSSMAPAALRERLMARP